jgi:hypothetical protein
MSYQDLGNATTQTIYKVATEPVFLSDQNLRPHENISWEVTSEPDDNEKLGETLTSHERDIVQVPEIASETQREEREEEDAPDQKESPEPDEEEKEKKFKKNRTSEKKRISDLTRQLKQAQSVAHDVLNRNQFLETKLNEKQKAEIVQREKLLLSEKERVKNYLNNVTEEGDVAKQVEAQDLLSQYNASLELLKNGYNPDPSDQKQYQAPQPKYQESQYEIDDVAQDWLDNNPWANPHSNEFDQSLHEEADNYSIKLAKKYTLSGRKNEIGSSDFFDEISDFMKKSYEISEPESQSYSKQEPKGRIQMKTETTTKTAPVSRDSNMGQSHQKPKDIQLTAEERETARSLAGFVRDPKTGHKVYDPKILEEIYRRNLRH